MEYTVGDRVRLIHRWDELQSGALGSVMTATATDVWVKFDNWPDLVWCLNRAIEPAATFESGDNEVFLTTTVASQENDLAENKFVQSLTSTLEKIRAQRDQLLAEKTELETEQSDQYNEIARTLEVSERSRSELYGALKTVVSLAEMVDLSDRGRNKALLLTCKTVAELAGVL